MTNASTTLHHQVVGFHEKMSIISGESNIEEESKDATTVDMYLFLFSP